MKKNILSFPVLPGIVFIWLTAMVLLPYDAYGQVNADSSSKPYSWFSAGIGGGSSGYSLGTGFSGQISWISVYYMAILR